MSGPAFLFRECGLHTLIHTSALEILLPHIVAISPKSNINVSAIYLNLQLLANSLDIFFIPLTSSHS